ncbi:unnamed protein product, partial [Porites lobata]
GHILSPLESSIRMTHYPSLPFSHPCTFHTLMEMSRLDGELGRPALVCICSERQWLLWRYCRCLAFITSVHTYSDQLSHFICYQMKCRMFYLKHSRRDCLMALQRERELKRQQDLEYEASQKADMEKEQRKRNSKACQCGQEPKEVPVEEEKTDEPPPKRLKSSEFKRLIVVLPDGKRHQMDVASNSTLMELYEQVNNLLPEGSEPIILSYQLEGGLWRKLPKHTMTVDEFGVVENVILRASNSYESDTAS